MKNKIVMATDHLFARRKINNITITDIAKKSKIAKGTVFLYFKTKEEIFLFLTLKKFDDLFNDFETSFTDISKSKNIFDEFFVRLENILEQNNDLFRLLAVLHIVIEDNIGYKTLYDFKMNMHKKLTHLGFVLESIFPFLKNKGPAFLQWIYVLLIGFEHTSNPSKIAAKVIDDEKLFHIYKTNLKKDLVSLLKVILTGLKYQK